MKKGHNGANPWASKRGRWACSCDGCQRMREAWPETTRIWAPQPGRTVIFGATRQDGVLVK